MKTDRPTQCVEGPDAFKRFDEGVRQILSVPHPTIVRRERAYKKGLCRESKSKGIKAKAQAFPLEPRFTRHDSGDGFRFLPPCR